MLILAERLLEGLGESDGDLDTETDGDELTEALGVFDAEPLGLALFDELGLPDGLGEALELDDTDDDGDGLALELDDTDALGLALGDLDALELGLRDADGLADGLALREDDGLALGDALADEDPALGIICQAADVDVPVLIYVLRPALSRSRKIAPLMKPAYPSGNVLPSASRIKSLESIGRLLLELRYLNTALVL